MCDGHAFFRDACTWKHPLYDARAEEIVETDPGDDDDGTRAEFTVEVIIRRTAKWYQRNSSFRPQVPPLTSRTANALPLKLHVH